MPGEKRTNIALEVMNETDNNGPGSGNKFIVVR